MQHSGNYTLVACFEMCSNSKMYMQFIINIKYKYNNALVALFSSLITAQCGSGKGSISFF